MSDKRAGKRAKPIADIYAEREPNGLIVLKGLAASSFFQSNFRRLPDTKQNAGSKQPPPAEVERLRASVKAAGKRIAELESQSLPAPAPAGLKQPMHKEKIMEAQLQETAERGMEEICRCGHPRSSHMYGPCVQCSCSGFNQSAAIAELSEPTVRERHRTVAKLWNDHDYDAARDPDDELAEFLARHFPDNSEVERLTASKLV